MTIKQAKLIAREWVNKEAAAIAGFCGAFYHGSVNWLAEEDILPSTSDIDIIVVLTDPLHYSSGKFSYGQLILEVSYLSITAFQSAEQILGTFYLAGSFRNPNIIADPSGHLTKLQQEVAEKYAAPYWVRQRCLDASTRSVSFMAQMKETDPLHDQVTSWLFGRGLMAHVLLVAGLKNPTVRKRYVEVQKLLAAYHALDFYERLLQLSGFADIDRGDVERHLITLTKAFDAASAVIKTPYRYAADISKIGRPVAIDGSYELLNAGFHREAMFWIVATHCRCQHMLLQDAPVAIREEHAGGFRQLLGELKMASFNDRLLSNQRAQDFMQELWEMAEVMISQKPDIEIKYPPN